LPNIHAQGLVALAAANKNWIGTTDPTQRLITTAQFASLDLTLPASSYSVYKRDVGESATARALQADLTGQHDTANTVLAQLVSHFIQVFNMAVGRGVFAASDPAFYGLDVSRSDVPPLVTHADIQQWAEKLVDGETARLDAHPGAIPMALPSAVEVAAALLALGNLEQTQSEAKGVYPLEQGDVEADTGPIDALILDLSDTIEFNLRALAGPTRRRRAREWGIVYLTRPGELPDPEPPVVPGVEPGAKADAEAGGDSPRAK
jgi:hypothetical protein